MASPEVERPSTLDLDGGKQKSKVTFNEASISSSRRISTSTNTAKKLRYEHEFRSRRKRTHSCSFSWDHFSKRRRSWNSIVLPSKFLLGGNITDPLNLEALDREDLTRNAEDSSNTNFKRGETVKVIIPPNINDPLNLDASSEDGDEQLADAIWKQRRRRKCRKRRRRNSEPGGLGSESEKEKVPPGSLEKSSSVENVSVSTKPLSPSHTKSLKETSVICNSIYSFQRQISEPALPTHRDVVLASTSDLPAQQQQQQAHSVRTNKISRHKGEDKIVSPVIPQPSVERKRHSSHQRHPSCDKILNASVQPPKKFNPKNHMFQYGNYNQYYGYRNPQHKTDPRLKVFQKDWFEGKEVLDIGCNIGHISFSVARDYEPRMVIGIDIDKKLIDIARKNVRHYISDNMSEESEYPRSMRILYGPVKPPVGKDGKLTFPYNIKFYQANFVLENEALLETVRPEFDVILCLSVTKWIHLNWGDSGLKMFFKRIFRNLRPQGILILEPQAWPSYTKKRKITCEIFENYKNIKLYPDKFGEYLTKEVGFTYVKKIAVSHHYSKGFQRPIFIYRKESFERKLKEQPAVQNASTPLLTDDTSSSLPCLATDDMDIPHSRTSSTDAAVENASQLMENISPEPVVDDTDHHMSDVTAEVAKCTK